MPACFSFTPVAIPPNPAPTTTTRGVPAGPNSASAGGFIGTAAGRSGRLRPGAGRRVQHVELRFVDADRRAVHEHVPKAGRRLRGEALAVGGKVAHPHGGTGADRARIEYAHV